MPARAPRSLREDQECAVGVASGDEAEGCFASRLLDQPIAYASVFGARAELVGAGGRPFQHLGQ
jgi:hypothetical protein